MVFGLVGILVTMFVIILIIKYAYGPNMSAVAHANDQAKSEVQQFGGMTADHRDVTTTYKLFADTNANGKLLDFQVADIDADSPMATYFGLKTNDVILSAEHNAVEFKMNQQDDEESAKFAIRDAFTMQGHLVVQRGDMKLTLPMAPGSAAPVAVAPANSSTPATSPSQPINQGIKNPDNEMTPDERLKALSHMNPGM